jgi:hypothetical protein
MACTSANLAERRPARGPRSTVGLPGTGLGFTTTKRRSPLLWIIGAIALAAFVLHLLR